MSSDLDPYESATCTYYSSGACASCSQLKSTQGTRRTQKTDALRTLLSSIGVSAERFKPLVSPHNPWASRSKVKMVAGGTTEQPHLGIVTPELTVTDLSECPLHDDAVTALLSSVKDIIRERRITPYSITARQGELKGITIMRTLGGASGIVRFVLRSTESVPRVRKAVPALIERHPWVKVVSCNIQPLAAALPEGPEEIILTADTSVEERYGPVSVHFTPQSFMQVTHEVAEALYRAVATIVEAERPDKMLDLFCGVAGFTMSAAPYVRSALGLELSRAAVECAQKAAARSGASHISFRAEDVDDESAVAGYDLVLVNPPRRGLSNELVERLLAASPKTIIYSSCNPETLARDLSKLIGLYQVVSVAPFDMFPLTKHLEVLVHLTRS